MSKVCSVCKVEKENSEFYKLSGNSDRLRSCCKKCSDEAARKYKLKNKQKRFEKDKQYRLRNKEKSSAYLKEYYVSNKETIKEQKQEYNKLNKQHIYERKKEYKDKHQEELRIYMQEYQKERVRTDINFKLARTLRTRLYGAIQSNQKVGSAIKDLGCTVEELKLYLESLFQPGMTWDNHSLHGWHIDHVIPLVSFDLTDREQFLRANHYTNLQPLWAEDNLEKGCKLDWQMEQLSFELEIEGEGNNEGVED